MIAIGALFKFESCFHVFSGHCDIHSDNVHMLIMNVSRLVQDVKIQMRLTWMA